MVKRKEDYLFFGILAFAAAAIAWTAVGCGPISPSVSKLSNAGSSNSSSANTTPNNSFKIDTDLFQSLPQGQSSGAAVAQDPDANVRFLSEDALRISNPFDQGAGWTELSSGEIHSLFENGKASVRLSLQSHDASNMDALNGKFGIYLIVRPKSGESKKGLKAFVDNATSRLSAKLTPCVVINQLSDPQARCTEDFSMDLYQRDSKNDKPMPARLTTLSELKERVVRAYVWSGN